MSAKTKNALQRLEIVEKVAKTTGFPKAQVERTLTSMLDTIEASLSKGQGVQITGYLTLSTGKRKARVGRNPKTGEALNIAAKKVVKARVGKRLSDAVLS